MSCRVNFHVVRSALQYSVCILFIFADQVFIDPTFSGIFVCGPLQSFVVNVCTIKNRNSVLNRVGKSAIFVLNRVRRLEVVGARKNGRARGRQARREGASSLSPRVSLSRAPILSCAHYFQAPATQATQLGGGKPVTSVVKD